MLIFRPLTRPVGLARSRHAADPFYSISGYLADSGRSGVFFRTGFVDFRGFSRFGTFFSVFGRFRTPDGARMDPGWTPDGPRMDPR